MFVGIEVLYCTDEGVEVYGEEICKASSLEDVQDEVRLHMLSEPWVYGVEIMELINTGTQRVWIPVEQV